MNTNYLETAVASAIPELAEIDAALVAIRARPSLADNVLLSAEQGHGLAAEAAAAVRGGRPLPADLGRRAFEADHAGEIAVAEARVMARAEQMLVDSRTIAMRAGAGRALVALRGPLAEILDAARAAAPKLRAIHTADDAVDAGAEAAEAWREVGRLAAEYAALRDAQRDLSLHAVGATLGGQGAYLKLERGPGVPSSTTVDSVLDLVGEFREPAPDWRIARRSAPLVIRAFEFGDRRAHLLAILERGDAVWLPTIVEARQAYAAACGAALEYENDLAKRDDRAPVVVRVDAGHVDRTIAALNRVEANKMVG